MDDTHYNVNYSEQQTLKDERGRQHIIEEIGRVKKKYSITNKSILELGCGGGANLMSLVHDNEVYGVDGCESAVELAQSRGLNVIKANLDTKFDLPDDSKYDWIMLIDVLEHLLHPKDLLKFVGQKLKVNGRIILNVPNHFNLSGRIKILFGKDLDVGNFFPDHSEWDNPHIRFFTYMGIKQLVNVAGYEIVEDRSCNFPAIPIVGHVLPYTFARRVAVIAPALFTTGFLLILSKRP